MTLHVETVVSPRRPSRGTPKFHFVAYTDPEVAYDDVLAATPAYCGQPAPPKGWIIVEEGLDHREYGISHVMCDRCFDKYRGPQH